MEKFKGKVLETFMIEPKVNNNLGIKRYRHHLGNVLIYKLIDEYVEKSLRHIFYLSVY